MSEATILDEIVEAKRRQLEMQKQQHSLGTLQKELQLSDRDFAAALQDPQPAFILECKKASPSKGILRPDFDLASIARDYKRFASAISVLTEPEYFQGSLANLKIVRENASQPILCKDFFIDPYQVYQARYFGADAVLLILAILTDAQWQELFELARSLNMDAITEVSNAEEMRRARDLNAPIVGINNRNLRDMTIDLGTTRSLASGLSSETLVISESGFYTNGQVRQMSDCADGFLIGSSLMAEQNLIRAIKQIIFGECKVCGLTRNEDALAADMSGAVYGGVIFAESSPRKIQPEKALEVFADTSLSRVGVFQDHDIEMVLGIARKCELEVIQFHGNEDHGFAVGVRDQLGDDKQYWKALSVDQLGSIGSDWLALGDNFKLVVDNQNDHMAGGTGKPFDWERLPNHDLERIIIAGGIGADNVAAAMRLGCCGVDMNSKLESQPGIKSAENIKLAFEQIRNYRSDG